MSLHIGFVLIEGDHRAQIEDIFAAYEYASPAQTISDIGFDRIFALDGVEVSQIHAVALINGWTVIIDNELVMSGLPEPNLLLSQQLHACVFTAICEGTSASYGFALFNNAIVRQFFASDGDILTNKGNPLPGEADTQLTQISEDDVLHIMRGIGVDYSAITAATFTAFVMAGEEPVSTVPEKPRQTKKPWWKFW